MPKWKCTLHIKPIVLTPKSKVTIKYAIISITQHLNLGKITNVIINKTTFITSSTLPMNNLKGCNLLHSPHSLLGGNLKNHAFKRVVNEVLLNGIVIKFHNMPKIYHK